MSSMICQNFVQNAWKKELCSNCFKSRSEHRERAHFKPLFSKQRIESIIKTSKKINQSNNRCVRFPNQLSEVIGYGGEDWSDNEEEDDETIDDESKDFEYYSDDSSSDELKKITKANTDFNTTSLCENDETSKKSYATLLLGKPLVDSDGKKKTPLLVPVKPFGEKEPPKKLTKTIIMPAKNRKESVTENNTNVILTSYVIKNKEEKSLLDEITETLESTKKDAVQIITRRKAETDDVANTEKTKTVEKKVTLTRTPALKREHAFHTSTARFEFKNHKTNKENAANVNNSTDSYSEKEQNIDEEDIVMTSTTKAWEDDKNSTTDSSLSSNDFDNVTREQVGEPDGRADSDNSEQPPALPLTPPPPLETQGIKPKVPTKPNTMLIRKITAPPTQHHETKPQILTTFAPHVTETTPLNSASSDPVHKRRAPKPPNASDEIGIFQRKPLNNLNMDAPPCLREKEKRERAASCPKIQLPPQHHLFEFEHTPEPAPRKSLSISTDSLPETTRREKKPKFSLKKFLRMGSNKDLSKLSLDSYKYDVDVDSGTASPPLPKPRLVIVHPSELNGAKVEVVKTEPSVYENVKINVKPPPPPRNFEEVKPPITPKSAEVVNINRGGGGVVVSRSNSMKKEETVYANIGEVRSSIVPNKPVRTASMREREAAAEDASKPLKKRSESTADIPLSQFHAANIPRSLSLTYCGSETESEIYSPSNFYGSENEDEQDWTQNGRTHKLRSRKGRSIVHKNLEDNYGAVIVANHEALAQVLENIQQTVHTPNALRALKTSNNLRWSDFTNLTQAKTLGKRAFHQATWNNHQVTLAINRGAAPSCTISLGTFNLNPVTEFNDLLPVKYIPGDEDQRDTDLIQATITVLPSVQIDSIESYDASENKDTLFVLLQLVNALKHLQAQGIEELPITLNSFVLCKEMERDVHRKLFVLQGLNENGETYGTLCNCASRAVEILQPNLQIRSLLLSLLDNERATSLTQVKSVLEFLLWGPSDVSLGTNVRDRELTLQRWLDLQRATVLHGLVCTRVQLTVYEEYHLLFLVRSNARLMCDASLLLESSKKNAHVVDT